MRRTRNDGGAAKKAEEARRLAACRALYCMASPVPGCEFCGTHWRTLPAEIRTRLNAASTFAELAAARSDAVKFIAQAEGPVA